MIDPKVQGISIDRVQNGWVIRLGNYYMRDGGGNMVAETFVARTPKELAELIEKWAHAQGDLPKP